MVIPLYQAEIAPPELRGSLVSLQQLSITIGTAISFWLDYGMQFVGGTTCNPEGISDPYLDGVYNAAVNHGHTCLGQKTIAWRLPLALQIIPAWILFFGMFWFPFSPRWLMMKHREEEALASLSRLRRLPATDPHVRAEFLEIKAAVMFDEETEQEAVGAGGALAPWKALFAPNMLKRLFLGCGTMICQQFTGINAVLYYAPQIFASFGFNSTKQTLLATGVTGILQITFTLPAVLYLDKFGRKTFLIVGAVGMFCCHVVVATVEGIYKPHWDLNEGLDKGQGWVAIVFIWLFAVNFAYSWGMFYIFFCPSDFAAPGC
jgi:MFS family permease